MSTSSFHARVDKAVSILGETWNTEKLVDALRSEGIQPDETGVQMLDSVHITVEIIQDIIHPHDSRKIPVRLAAIALKGNDPYNTAKPLVETVGAGIEPTQIIQQMIMANRPLEQWSDEELLRAYIEDERDDLEFQLNKRAKGRRFVVANGDGTINIQATLTLLKKSRKEEIPQMFLTSGGESVYVRRIEEYHSKNRIQDESPFFPNVALFEGCCPVSMINFDNVPLRIRQFLRHMIGCSDAPPSYKGTRDFCHGLFAEVLGATTVEESQLAKRHPDCLQAFHQMEALGKLPPLKMLSGMPSASVKADPFKPGNNFKVY